MKLNLGCGSKPLEGYINHDKYIHSPWVNVGHDLELLPWPWPSASQSQVIATDVFEHLRPWRLEVHEWLAECWRILKMGGCLSMRLPAYDYHYSWRDPTHYRVFHEESFDYFCPKIKNTVHEQFGRYYWGPDYKFWWHKISACREEGDIRFLLMKI